MVPPDQPWYGLGHGAIRSGRPGLDVVLPELLIGEYPAPDDIAWLRAQHGVDAVCSLQDDADLASKRLDLAMLKAACRLAHMAFARIPVPDGDVGVLAARLPAIVDRIATWIADGRRVYLHCNAGMNRAPTAAIAYLHIHRGMSLADAVAFVKARRLAIPYLEALRACYPGP